MRQYQIDPDGQIRNVDDLRDLVHNLACEIHSLLQNPMVRMSMNPMEFLIIEAAAVAAHNSTCPHAVEAQQKTDEGTLGPLNIEGLGDLSDLFKNFQ